jgi:mannose-6-phosphate isomerase-like protein (cupin superfamily)
MSEPFDLSSIPIHLGRAGRAEPQEPHTGDMAWYQRYGERNAADGAEGRLVTMHSFAEPWSMWEVHPNGHEVVLCVSGRIVVHQEHPDGTTTSATLEPGSAIINPPGVWHTADVDAPATALFITSGAGTEHRER